MPEKALIRFGKPWLALAGGTLYPPNRQTSRGRHRTRRTAGCRSAAEAPIHVGERGRRSRHLGALDIVLVGIGGARGKMLITSEGVAVFGKQRDHAATVGVVAILLGLIIIGGISYTYMTRPALIEAATKRVLDIRQLFEDTFR